MLPAFKCFEILLLRKFKCKIRAACVGVLSLSPPSLTEMYKQA